MLSRRLSIAAEMGHLNGRVTVWGGRAEDDLSDMADDVKVVQRLAPQHLALAARGVAVAVDAVARCDTAVVALPRSRAAARDLIARAAGFSDGAVLIDGQKTDGIDAMLREIRDRAEVVEVIAKAHGKLVVARGGDFAGWRQGPAMTADGWTTAPGVFSADGVDPGSALLAGALPASMSGRVADLGAGWGYLPVQVLRRDGVTECHLVEADCVALDCARANVTDPRARFHWADATAPLGLPAMQHVVMNPPFHAGRRPDPGLGDAFVAAAAAALSPGGVAWVVANRHLPYEATLRARFAEVAELPGSASFRLWRAARPISLRSVAAGRRQ
jgi:16S rRNA (guanine1207-N2)-methyltransferase